MLTSEKAIYTVKEAAAILCVTPHRIAVANFGRAYFPDTLVTVTAPPSSAGRPFLRWKVDGVTSIACSSSHRAPIPSTPPWSPTCSILSSRSRRWT